MRCEKNLSYWAVYNLNNGFRVTWCKSNILITNYIDDHAQSPFRFRVGYKTEIAIKLLKHLNIPEKYSKFKAIINFKN